MGLCTRDRVDRTSHGRGDLRTVNAVSLHTSVACALNAIAWLGLGAHGFLPFDCDWVLRLRCPPAVRYAQGEGAARAATAVEANTER